MRDIEIHSYSKVEDLHAVLSKKCDIASCDDNSPLQFLDEYLRKELKANYIVVEDKYINQDYLDDFAFYYVYCFKNYKLTCRRLHFFNSSKGKEEFKIELNKAVIKGGKIFQDFFDTHYLGHTVIKPIESTFVGHTLVRHPNTFNKKPPADFSEGVWIETVKNYNIHFYGNSYTIESLAFQEQDANVAACATIAIWTLYQMAAEDYHVLLEPPSQITEESAEVSSSGDRVFPNDGLDTEEICRAITRNNLDTEVRQFYKLSGDKLKVDKSKIYYWKALIYAYLPLKIPPLLGIYIPSYGARHLVAVTGYNLSNRNLTNGRSRNTYRLTSDRLDTLYVHDDQYSPFVNWKSLKSGKFASPWSELPRDHIFPIDLVLSTYKAVRISYDDIENNVEDFMNCYLKIILENYNGQNKKKKSNKKILTISDFEVSIRLIISEQFKESLHKTDFNLNNRNKEQKTVLYYLMKPHPKYIWRVDVLFKGTLLFTFVYDATALKTADKLLEVLFFDKIFLVWLEKYNTNDPNDNSHDIETLQKFTYWQDKMKKMLLEFQFKTEPLKRNIISKVNY